MKIGVITNPGSQKNKTGLAEVKSLLDGQPDVHHAVLDQIADVPGILADFARQGVEVVAVAGGDGTVHAVFNEIFGRRPFAETPRICVVPRGMTNMIAGDVGLKKSGLPGLRRLIGAARRGDVDRHLVTRRVLRLDNAEGQPPLYGMFFGGAGITRAIDACRTKVHARNIKADPAIALTLAGLLASWLFHRGRSAEEGETLFYGDRISLAFDDEAPVTGEHLLVLGTTLDHLILGSRPYWGNDSGHLRFTSIGFPPKRLLRYARRILYGAPDRQLPAESYLSRSADRVALRLDCPFTLDGEFYRAAPGREVILTAADEVRFVRL
jgi:diacylglycerol kinase family enzyme